jgi:hypothetical protein
MTQETLLFLIFLGMGVWSGLGVWMWRGGYRGERLTSDEYLLYAMIGLPLACLLTLIMLIGKLLGKFDEKP